ncbi:MAG: hypothetical protein WBD11_18155, partial [Xanthobacteraceae bacterium]
MTTLYDWAHGQFDLSSFARVVCGANSQGRKPSDLPVQQSTKVAFVINLKTAKSLSLSIPLPL